MLLRHLERTNVVTVTSLGCEVSTESERRECDGEGERERMSERHEITISGFLVKGPKIRHVVNAQKTLSVFNAEDEAQALMVEDAVETLKEESRLLETHIFGTKIEVPKEFLPTAVGGIAQSFKMTTIAKMVKEVKVTQAAIKRRVSSK